MTTQDETTPALVDKPRRRGAINPSVPLLVTRKVRDAIHAMIWQGLKRDQAAEQAGIKDNSLYVALRRPDVKAHYLAELEVLRTSERARNIHAWAQIRDESTNDMARVQAGKAIEGAGDVEAGRGYGASLLPGLQIVVIAADAPSSAPIVDVLPKRE